MTDKFLNFTGKTLVPLSSITVLAFAIVWITEIKSEVKVSAERIKITENQQEKILQKLDENTKKLSRIEGLLEFIKKRIK